MLLSRVPSFLAQADADALLGDPALHGRIVQAVNRANAHKRRTRRLPDVLMMYVVLGLSLYRRLPIPEVLKELLNGLRWVMAVVCLLRFPPAESSLSEARYRLGYGPLKSLFEASVAIVSSPPTFHGMRVSAIDGVRFIVADTPHNEAAFGRPKSARGKSAYPVVLVVAMVDVYSHQVVAISILPHNGSERMPVLDLIEDLDKDDLVLMDRGFPSANLLWQLAPKINFLARISSTWKPEIVSRSGTGDYLVRVAVKIPIAKLKVGPAPSSRKGRKPSCDTVFMTLRMLVYKCDGKRTIRLLTNLLDPSITALELAKLYHERWEIELTFDEIKNHFSVGFHGSPDLCVRSKDPVGVRQELYGLFAMFNHTRHIIAEAAASYGLKPLDISFVKALNAIRRVLPLLIATTAQERENMIEDLYREIVVDCRGRDRRPRHYARKIKVKMSDFKCKKPGDGQTVVDFVAQTQMVDPAPGLAEAA
jgi:hypothetical protein